MKIVRDFARAGKKFRKTVVAIGIFDGMHLGHQRLIGRAVKSARRLGAKAAILTFSPHPAKISRPDRKISAIYPFEDILALFSFFGVDLCAVIKSDPRFLKTAGESFVRDILARKMRAAEVYVGSNFRFGPNQHCDVNDLRRFCRKYNILMRTVRLARAGREDVSSTRVRTLIRKGSLAAAEKLLSRPVSLSGVVIRGRAQGSAIGYPTANIKVGNICLPPAAVYAVRALLSGRMYAGMLYIGPRPVIREPRKKGFISVYERQVSVEAHLFDFTERVYGCHIRLFFVCKLRNNRKFRSKEGLIRYLARDKEKTLQVLRKKKEPSFPLNCFTSPFRGDTMKPKW